MTDSPPILQQASLEVVDVSPDEATAVLEAMLFASGDAEDIATLSTALGWNQKDVRAALTLLEDQLRAARRGIVLQRDGDRFQLVTSPRYGQSIARLLGLERRTRLSSAALETLALVAYRQPVTRAEIEAVRGVDSSGVLSTLLARELIEAQGRRPSPGNPVEYVTTALFLQFFGLTSLNELPPAPDDTPPA